MSEGNFDVVIDVPYRVTERIPELMREALRTTFGVIYRKEPREMEAYVLTAKNHKLEPTVSTGGSSSSSGPGRISAVNGSLTSLAWNLEAMLGKPVVDETGLTNHYDFQLKWKQEKEEKKPAAEKLVQALRDQLGLDLTPAKRQVEVTVVETEPVKD